MELFSKTIESINVDRKQQKQEFVDFTMLVSENIQKSISMAFKNKENDQKQKDEKKLGFDDSFSAILAIKANNVDVQKLMRDKVETVEFV